MERVVASGECGESSKAKFYTASQHVAAAEEA